MKKKDYALSIIAGILTAVFIFPVLRNIEIGIKYYKFLFFIIPLAWVAVIFVSRFLKIKWIKQFAKFGIVGFLNTSLDFGVLNILSLKYGIYSGVRVAGINPLSFIVALVNSFFWNKYWTFEEKTAPEAKEAVKFFLVAAIGVLINTSIVFMFTKYFPVNGLTEAQVLNLGKALATGFSLIWNFLGMKIFVFYAKPRQISADAQVL